MPATFLRLSQYRVFWRIRALLQRLQFSVLSRLFRARDVIHEQRDPTAEELLKMEALVDKAMREGVVGLSSGLIYVPGTYSKTPELIALARAAAKHNGVYASHMRNEGDQVLAAIAETVQIGREARLPV